MFKMVLLLFLLNWLFKCQNFGEGDRTTEIEKLVQAKKTAPKDTNF